MQRPFKLRHRRLFDHARWVVVMAVLSTFASAAFAQARAPQEAQVATTSAPTLTAAQQAEFARAQSAAERILARAEFQRPEPTWWDKLKAKIGEIIVRFFLGIDRVTTQSPWVGRALEWLLFIAAAVGILVWVLRAAQRQRLRVALGGEPAKAAARSRETEDWRRLAEHEAARGAWREAIHALYWAAIVHLEQRRAWRHNPSRTPREYVRLLKPGSDEQRELRMLTNALERSWYGKREPNELEFGAARKSFDRLADGQMNDVVAGDQA
jgi:hypothetical protein